MKWACVVFACHGAFCTMFGIHLLIKGDWSGIGILLCAVFAFAACWVEVERMNGRLK